MSSSKPPLHDAAYSWKAATVCGLGLLALGCSALHLSAYGLTRYINSDFLTPFFFCSNVLAGRYPLSGWTLSASPYFLPDHLVLSALLKGFGRSGLAYALFTLVFYPLFFGLAGCCLKTVVGRGGPALVGGMLFGSGLLALRALPGHSLWLWWLGAPCCHGGVLLLGFAYLWTLATGLRRGVVGRLPVGLFCLALAGLLSDTLFLFQILLPATVALFICGRRYPGIERWLRWQGGSGAAALLCSQLFKPLCYLGHCFYFSRIIRVSPTPQHQWHALRQFVSDLPALLHDGWGFALLALAAAISLFGSLRAWRRAVPITAPASTINGGVLDFFRVFCVVSLLLMLPLPVLICSWKDVNNVRYLLNWLVLPGFVLTLETVVKWGVPVPSAEPGGHYRRWGLVAAAAFFLVCLACAASGLRHEALRFPYPGDVADLDAILQRRGLQRGLAQYWDAKYVTALSHAGAEVRQIRPDGTLYFWDNNAFGYYEADSAGTLSWPAYQYVLTDLLDEPAVARVFGEPQAKETAGRFQVWIYSEDGQRRIRDALEPGVREKLGPERLVRLREPTR